MSRAESPCVGGDGGVAVTSGGRGELGSLSHENGPDGPGVGLGLSFSVILSIDACGLAAGHS